MPASIHGQVVLVVGASSGIGRSAAALFAREGARVVAAARRQDRLQSLKDDLATEHLDITIRRADACSLEDMQHLTKETLAEFEKIDIVLYACGTNTPERTMDRLQPGVWNSILDTNLNGAFFVSHAVLPPMRAAQSGHLIYVSSMAGLMPDLSGAAYQASKRGLLGLAHAIRLEEQRNGIRTCVVCPGLTNTELVDKRPEKLAPEVLAKALQPQDVAETILHIAKLPRWVAIPEIQMTPAEL
ncbi:MAG TPA: SDR family oxidoreductase [Acidobacteriaceae bacterium]|nr:SDR family oxidoreductase [Acidobacteriaceae bacterium]